ncbi:MAG: asparaginase domain-containing protein [Saccharofermentans sp.]|nr:asparaginase domain-containing protein [Saccharofermentans sp.]
MAKAKSNVLVVSLGGTITSEIESGVVKQSGFYWDSKFFESIDDRFIYSTVAPSGYSSENATVSDYRRAINGIVAAVNDTEPEGVLVLHGTDSVAYFAQLAVRVLSHLNVPVIITGSKLPPSHRGSDAVGNVRLALGFIGAAIEGKTGSKTFGVVFNDSFTGESTFVHASSVTSPDISGDIKPFMDPEVKKKIDFRGSDYKKRAEIYIAGGGVSSSILVIPSVPGFPYGSVSLEGVGAVVIESYHSGTAESHELPELVRKAVAQGIPCYLGPVPSRGSIYESRKELEKSGVKALSGMPFEGCWAEAALG